MFSTVCQMLGFTRSNLHRDLLFSNNSEGDTPVVACGVMRYAKSIFANRVLKVPSVSFFRPLFTICTARSARPLLAGWWGAEVMCLTQQVSDWNTGSVRTMIGHRRPLDTAVHSLP